MLILNCNAGSTSLKYKLYDMPSQKVLASARMERIGSENMSTFSFTSEKWSVQKTDISLCTYEDGVCMFNYALLESGVIKSLNDIACVGFKTVLAKGYPGVHFIDGEVLQGLEDYLSIAPVHNSAYLNAISAVRAVMPKTPLVGVFETHFHTTIPEYARVYGIPYEWTENYGIQKYGFHGSSHRYIAKRASELLGASKIISCHMGGSSSICAIDDGKSVDTSFGMSLQTGIIHGTRTGDLDPFIPIFLQKEGLSLDEVEDGLVSRGGLKGISGVSEDMRDIEQAAALGNERAALALNCYAYGVVKYIGSFFALLGGADALVFTGGIGENSAYVREKILRGIGGLKSLGFLLDTKKNEAVSGETIISAPDSTVKIAVIPTNEEFTMVNEIYETMLKK